jgi:flagellar motor switch protein FliG
LKPESGWINAGGVDDVVEILNMAPRSVEKLVVESLERSDPGLAEEIKRRMFVFEDIVLLERGVVGKVLAEVAEEDLFLALKAAPENVRNFIWDCAAKNDVGRLKAAFEASGRTRLHDVEAAQQRIVGTIRKMEEDGRIFIERPGDATER